MIKLFAVFRYQVVREAIEKMCWRTNDIRLIGQAESGSEALRKLGLCAPDILLTEIKLEPGLDGIVLSEMLVHKHPRVKTIMLSLYYQYLNEALRAGAKGYLTMNTRWEDIAHSIRRVNSGGIAISIGVPLSVIQDKYYPSQGCG